MSDPLRQAIAAIKAGDKVGGRRLLAVMIRSDPRNEAAWLWMSAATDSDEQRRTCLERVLAINPDNPTARRGLAGLGPALGGTGPTFGRTGPTFGRTGPTFGRTGPTSGRTGPASQPPGPSSPGAPPEPGGPPSPGIPPLAGHALPSVGQARRAKAVLPWWSLLIAFGATVAVCATIGIAAYLALSGVVGVLRNCLKGRLHVA
jgi:hypothetical protein